MPPHACTEWCGPFMPERKRDPHKPGKSWQHPHALSSRASAIQDPAPLSAGDQTRVWQSAPMRKECQH